MKKLIQAFIVVLPIFSINNHFHAMDRLVEDNDDMEVVEEKTVDHEDITLIGKNDRCIGALVAGVAAPVALELLRQMPLAAIRQLFLKCAVKGYQLSGQVLQNLISNEIADKAGKLKSKWEVRIKLWLSKENEEISFDDFLLHQKMTDFATNNPEACNELSCYQTGGCELSEETITLLIKNYHFFDRVDEINVDAIKKLYKDLENKRDPEIDYTTRRLLTSKQMNNIARFRLPNDSDFDTGNYRSNLFTS